MASLSVVIPTLNEERYLGRLLNSLMPVADLISDVVVVDGHSDDNTVAIARSFRSKGSASLPLACLTSDFRNVAAQRNQGAAASKGELILFLDADVTLIGRRTLEAALKRFSYGDSSVLSVRFVPQEGGVIGWLYLTVIYVFHRLMARLYPYSIGGFLLTSRRVFEKVGGFDPAIKVSEDANFCLRALKFGRFCVLPETVSYSMRRFRQYGYIRMGFKYVWLFLYRTFIGEIKRPPVPYEFGRFR